MKEKICAFTGHRPHRFPWKGNEADSRCVALKTVMTDQILLLADSGVTSFFSGGAAGVDCWAALMVLTLREKKPALKLHCILPYEGQADGWSDSEREIYQAILKQANSVKYVSQDYYDGCMIDRNHRLVESAGMLLAVYNGARRSGTGATVNYARKLGRKIIIIDPLTQAVTHEGGRA